MKKLLVASVFALAPLTAFAGGFVAAGDINNASTSVSSSAGVGSTQGTGAGSMVDGKGAVVVGAVSGNYTSVQTGGTANAGPKGSSTTTNAQQTNVGGTISGGMSTGRNATGMSGVGQNSQANGGASASASNTNTGGFVATHHGH
jgi:hypothetical protein